jgi:peptidoglycan/LPS O-acetylase OafA/YrhL
MTPFFSLYLDGLRCALALSVFVTHALIRPYGGSLPTAGVSGWDKEIVAGLFVLSGFLAELSLSKYLSLGAYLRGRATRLLAGLLPGVILGEVVVRSLGLLDTDIEFPFKPDRLGWEPAVATLMFLNRIWFLHLEPIGNAPLWYIGIVAWCYVLFAILSYLPTPRRQVLFLVMAVLVGPQVLLFLVLFLVGVGAAKIREVSLPLLLAVLFWLGSIMMAALYFAVGVRERFAWHVVDWIGSDLARSLQYRRFIVSDIVFGSLMALNLWAAGQLLQQKSVQARLTIPEPISRLVRALARSSYGVYVFQAPALFAATAVFPWAQGSIWMAAIDGIVLALLVVAGLWLEPFRRHIDAVFECLLQYEPLRRFCITHRQHTYNLRP